MSDFAINKEVARISGNRTCIFVGGATTASSTKGWKRCMFLRNSNVTTIVNSLMTGSLTSADTIIAGGVIGGNITKIGILSGGSAILYE